MIRAADSRRSGSLIPCLKSESVGRRVRARRPISLAVALGLGLLAAACAGGPPDNPDNACAIFKDKRA